MYKPSTQIGGDYFSIDTINVNNSTNIFYYVGTGAVTSEARATPFSLKTWYHLAMVRQGNAIGCYLNGVLFGSYMLTFTMGSGERQTIGHGYCSCSFP